MSDTEEEQAQQANKLANAIKKLEDNSFVTRPNKNSMEDKNINGEDSENDNDGDDDDNEDSGDMNTNTNSSKNNVLSSVILSGKRERRQSQRNIIEDTIVPKTRRHRMKKKKSKKSELKKKKDLLKTKKQKEKAALAAAKLANKKSKKLKLIQEMPEENYIYEDQRGLLDHPNPNLLDLALFNRIFETHSSELKKINEGKQERKVYLHELPYEQKYASQAMITCDIGQFDFAPLVAQFKSFDVIMVSPRQEQEEWTVQQFIDCRVDELSEHGFMFFWTGNLSLSSSYTVMTQWGYDVIEQIVWVKIDKQTCMPSVSVKDASPFLDSKEICLVGVKKRPNSTAVEYMTKVANNVMIAAKTSYAAAPDQIYNTIDLVMPGSKIIELFSKQLPLRTGWFGLKHQKIDFTNENKGNKNILNTELSEQPSQNIYANAFMNSKNQPSTTNLNFIKKKPNCSQNTYNNPQIFRTKTCFVCAKTPLIGIYFTCNDCAVSTKMIDYYNICQECFFNQSPSQPTPSKHLPQHSLSLVTTNNLPTKTTIECCNTSCLTSQSNELTIRKCTTCFEVYLCHRCISEPDKLKLPPALSRTHKVSHEFIAIKQGSYVPFDNK